MQTYIVGGFVRDLLLSAEGSAARPNDRDWVVVGETPESMIRRASNPSEKTSPFSCIRKRTRSMPSHEPSAKRRLATMVLCFTQQRTSRSKKT